MRLVRLSEKTPMILKYKLSSFFIILVVLSHNVFAYKKLPPKFFIDYELFQFIKLRNVDIEKTQISSGEIKLNFERKNKNYDLNIKLTTKKFLKLYGDKVLDSQGSIHKKGLSFNTFVLKDLKKPKKNIRVLYSKKKERVLIEYKKQITEKQNIENLLDIPSLILQFHFEKSKPKYTFDFIDGKKIRKVIYQKIKDEKITIDNNIYMTELYEGTVPLVKNSEHFVWLSKENYRIPIKIRFKMKGGLMIDKKIKRSNLVLKN